MGLICITNGQNTVSEIERDGKYLEVERDQRENKGLQVLHKVVEHSQAIGVIRIGHIGQRADLRGL